MPLFRRNTPDASSSQPVSLPPAVESVPPRSPLLKTGRYAWAAVGIGVFLIGAAYAVGRVSLVAVPLILALFPAAVLTPLVGRLTRRGMPAGLAALVVLLGTVALLAGIFTALGAAVAGQFADLSEQIEQGYAQLNEFLQQGAFGFQAISIDEMIERVGTQLSQGTEQLGTRVTGAATVIAEGFVAFVLFLFALFFYLKDGARIASWIRDLLPVRLRADAQAIGERAWLTIRAYIGGQLVIALVDAVLIGLGLLILGIPLVLPLSVLVFIGGLFPIVGAVLAGLVAVLVALASGGPVSALLVLAVIVGVQQVEGHLLQPIIMGRATALHPLAAVVALTVGGILLGILGAFLAIPVTASGARAVGYLRSRVPG